MGVDTNVYLGPYIECQNHWVDSSAPVLGCANCKKESKAKFCPNCGTKNSSFDVPYRELGVNMEDGLDALMSVDSMCGPRPGEELIDRYVSNIDWGNRTFNIELDDSDHHCLDIDRDPEVEEFNITFADEIQLLKDSYGEERVKLRYGLLIWFS